MDLGEANSRMKDYYDLVGLSRLFAFDGLTLSRAIAATFRRRETEIPAVRPVGLSAAFGADRRKTAQWTAFTRREPLLVPPGDLPEAIEAIAAFIMPAAVAARKDGEFAEVWAPGGPWRGNG